MAAAKTKTKAKVNTAPIDADELEQRVAILRRFRELLVKQRDRFYSYIAALEKQQTIIESGTTDELLAHVELEEQIVADILSIQKVIDPLEGMYQAAIPAGALTGAAPADDVPELKSALENLKKQAVARSAHNRDLLSTRMASIRSEITTLRNNPFTGAARSLYENSISASLIDIKG